MDAAWSTHFRIRSCLEIQFRSIQSRNTLVNRLGSFNRGVWPPGYCLEWAGQFKNCESAKAKLKILVLLAVFLIFFMLVMHRESIIETLVIMLSVPFSLMGAVWLIWLLEYKLSVAVWVGMIAVAGLAVELGLLMMVYLDLAYHRDRFADNSFPSRGDLAVAIENGASQRRPTHADDGVCPVHGVAPDHGQ